MGYTTEFTGAVKLGRKLTMAEAKELLGLALMMIREGCAYYRSWH